MNLKAERRLLIRYQQTLKQQSVQKYRKLLYRILEEHHHLELTHGLSAALRAKDYRALYEVADSLSVQKYTDATTHYVANQLALLIKKYPWPTDLLDLRPREKAVETFLSTERRMGLINRKYRILSRLPERDRFSKERNRAKFWIRSVIGSTPDYRMIFSSCDFGPGASLGVHGNSTNYARKFSSERWSVSPGALHHAYAGIRSNHHLYEALCPRGVNGMICYDEEKAFEAYLSRVELVQNNKISFVPKTAKTERSIAVEPLLNGFVQKGIDQVLRKKLLRVGIDLRDQGRNQEMARLGSLDDSDDGFVTIDLKSASDSVSIELIRYLLPDDWFRLLQRTRSHAYELDSVVRRYEKLCSMGNGFCFPIETLVFAAACHAVGAGSPWTDYSVYGDDIIVRKRYAAPLLALLGHWGFKVNTEKTFLSGQFRESCGSDWFGGQDVRPFTLDFALDSVSAHFKFLNLVRARARSDSFFSNIRGLVCSWLDERWRFFRPFSGNVETAIDSLGDEHLVSPHCRYRNGMWKWCELVASPRVDFDVLEKTQGEPWLIGVALRGSTSIGFGRYRFLPEVTLRRETETKIVRKGYASTSNWLPAP